MRIIGELLMQKRKLGRTDLSVAPVVFGGNVFGWTVDAKTSFDLLDRFAAAGLNAIDTADVYSSWAPGNQGGESETIIGEWMKARGNRNAIDNHHQGRLADGARQEGPFGALHRRGGRSLAEAAARSRRSTSICRIGPTTRYPHEETLGAYKKLIAKGKIRWCGASNFSAAQLSAALAASAAKGLPRYEVLQPEYNLYDRGGFDGALRDLCIARGDRRHHLFQPRQGLSLGQVPGAGRSGAERARRRRQGLSESARVSHPDALEAVAARHAPSRRKSRWRG